MTKYMDFVFFAAASIAKILTIGGSRLVGMLGRSNGSQLDHTLTFHFLAALAALMVKIL